MTDLTLTFDAIAEAVPSPKCATRWRRCWSDYRAWFIANGGDEGPNLAARKAALRRYMPELTALHARLSALAGGFDTLRNWIIHQPDQALDAWASTCPRRPFQPAGSM